MAFKISKFFRSVNPKPPLMGEGDPLPNLPPQTASGASYLSPSCSHALHSHLSGPGRMNAAFDFFQALT